ncbi:MAG: hypothetical protein AB7N61_23185 [Acidimicrobiia bacterium]
MTDLLERAWGLDLPDEPERRGLFGRGARGRGSRGRAGRVDGDDELLDGGRVARVVDRISRARFETWVSFVLIVGSSAFTIAQLHPELIVASTTPTGGDFGAHVWGPAYLRDHLLPKLRLNGWTPDWYAGFPMYQFYMVIPALLVVLLDVFVPYGIALKIVSVLGIATLPIAAATFARAAGLSFPFPPLAAMAATWFLFDESFTIYGGNIASTMAGEFSFSIALSLALFALASLTYGMRTGKGRALTAALFALCALCHLIVCFFALIGAVVMFVLYFDRHRFKYGITIAPVVALLVAFWMLPFYFGRDYMTDMRYERRPIGNAPNGLPDSYWQMLFPQGLHADWVIMGLALVGLVGSVIRGRRFGVWLAVMAIGYGTWAVLWPQSHLWNARLLPFLYLTRFMLAAVGFGEIMVTAGDLVARLRTRAKLPTQVGLLTAAVLAVLVMLGMGLRTLPGGELHNVQVGDKTVTQFSWGPFNSNHAFFVDDWAKWNYAGYERKSGYAEYRDIMLTMQRIGETNGCGRAEWEYTKNQNRYGTTMAMMLLPYWTDSCIGSMEGLFFESSATTPFHFMMAAALSQEPSNPVRSMPYPSLDVNRGVREMQLTGVRYYMAFSEQAVAQAAKQPNLRELAVSGPWHVYEVAGSELVTPLRYQPAVVDNADGRAAWLDISTKYFTTPDSWDVTLAQDGPAEWERVDMTRDPEAPKDGRTVYGRVVTQPTPAKTALPPVVVRDIATDDDEIVFTVDQIGVPVLVKTSYFPNWKVDGAKGPYRVAPNQMVVIPTSTSVRLHYGRTGIDYASMGLTALGLVGLAWLVKAGPIDYPVRPRRRRPGEDPFIDVVPGDAWLFEWGDDDTQLAWAPADVLHPWSWAGSDLVPSLPPLVDDPASDAISPMSPGAPGQLAPPSVGERLPEPDDRDPMGGP